MSDVVIIEDESVLREVLAEGLSGVLPDLSFCKYGSVEEAVAGIEELPPRLVISDVRLPGKSGVDFLIDAQVRWPDTRFILMTAFATLVSQEQAHEYGALRLLRKPFSLQDLAQAVETALQEESFTGRFRGISLIDLMQVINLGQKTLAISVRRGDLQAEIFFQDGEIIHVVAGQLEGVAAFNELVRWQGGALDVRYGLKPEKVTIRESFQHLILDALRLIDVENRDAWESAGGTPHPNGSTLRKNGKGIHVSESFADLSEDSATHYASETENLLSQQVEDMLAEVDDHERREQMLKDAGSALSSKILSRINFDPLLDIEGFLAAALVECESGMCLGSQARSEYDIETAASDSALLMRGERVLARDIAPNDAVEDLLISYGQQYHILRPLRSNQSFFLYGVFARTHSNLAMVRHALRAFESELHRDV